MTENERKTFPTCLPGKHSRKRGMLLFVGGCSQGWDISVPSPLPPPKKKRIVSSNWGYASLHASGVCWCVSGRQKVIGDLFLTSFELPLALCNLRIVVIIYSGGSYRIQFNDDQSKSTLLIGVSNYIPTFSFHQCVARIRLPGIHWHSETSERGKPASFEPASYGSARVLCAGSARVQNVRISRSRPFAKLSRARFVRRLLKLELGVCGYSKQQSDSHL